MSLIRKPFVWLQAWWFSASRRPPSPEWKPAATFGSREGLRETLDGVQALLGYLNRLPETRLDRFFKRGDQPAVRNELTPPCEGQGYLFARIAAIATASISDTFDPAGHTSPANKQGEGTAVALSDFAFIFWARDFLAAVASPASVETIRITQAFRIVRLGRRPQSSAETREQRYGALLAERVGRYQFLLVGLIFLAFWATFLAFTGRTLVAENASLRGVKANLAADITLAEERDRPLITAMFRAGGTNTAAFLVRDYCDYVFTVQPGAGAPPTPVPATPIAEVAMPSVDRLNATDGGPASPGSVTEATPAVHLFVSANQRNLCEERAHLAAREKQLTEKHAEWLRFASPATLLVELPSLPLRFFGIVSTDGLQATPLRLLDLETHRYGMSQTVDGLIGSIMPMAYAAIGALASLFRRLSRQAEAETLGPGDYGGSRISLILGLVTGAVIGLFADVLPKPVAGQTPTLPLTPTALALLAGFAADRVFTLFDQLADRIFGTAK